MAPSDSMVMRPRIDRVIVTCSLRVEMGDRTDRLAIDCKPPRAAAVVLRSPKGGGSTPIRSTGSRGAGTLPCATWCAFVNRVQPTPERPDVLVRHLREDRHRAL